MPAPVQNTLVVQQGLARLTGAYVNQPNARAWLKAILTEVQALENAVFSVISGRILANAQVLALPATNPVFDSLGALVGQPRGGMSDTLYKSAIYLRVAANRATGRVGDWSTFGAILLRTSGGPVVYYQTSAETPGWWGAAFYFGVWDMALDPLTVASVIDMGVPSGVYGCFVYSTWPDGGDFECDTVYSSTPAPGGGLSSVYSTSTGGTLVASLALN